MLLLDAAGSTSSAKSAPLKAAAAAAGAQPSMRASAAPAPAPKFNVDPMMSGMTEAAAPSRSFADSELPPLSVPAPDQFAAPPPPPELSALETPAPPGSTLFTTPAPVEKKKFELPQIETKLLIHGLLGGLAIILLFVGAIVFYVHTHTSDDEGAPLPAATAKPSETPAEVPSLASNAEQVTQSAPEPPPAQEAATAESATAESATAESATVQTRIEHKAEAKSEPRSKRTKEVASRAPIAAAPGLIAVDSSPQGAQVQVDGRVDSSWTTPFTVAQLAPGPHTLVISKSGYAAETKSLTIAAGSKNTLSVHLNVLAAAISVTSDPSGASIFIDGRDSGKVTPSSLTLEKGSHGVLVRKPGFLDEIMTADVQPGQTIGFAPRLRQLGSTDEIRSVNKVKKLFGGKDGLAGMGSVAIHTTPKGAQISINQRVLDHLSPAEFLLNPGNYVVDITASGCKPLHRVITVEKNGKLSIDETLERE
jgi:hypothetical protein